MIAGKEFLPQFSFREGGGKKGAVKLTDVTLICRSYETEQN